MCNKNINSNCLNFFSSVYTPENVGEFKSLYKKCLFTCKPLLKIVNYNIIVMKLYLQSNVDLLSVTLF